ncbi:MAG: DUF4157 domain-containing protein [Kofleriaceae bacterium]
MTREKAQLGPTFEPAIQQAPVAAPEPGRTTRATTEPGYAAGPAPIEIAPDQRDHHAPPALRAQVDTELRTLVAHVERNVEQYSIASTQPDREAALQQLDTRVDVALWNVPATEHATFRDELHATLGDRVHAVASMLEGGDRLHGVRAAQLFGVTMATPSEAPVQRRASGGRSAIDVHAHATRGVSGAATQLPHRDAIQKAFGHHDLGGVRAHVGGVAADASAAIGARAYTRGDAIAFASAPDLRLAAHEAAHVVQQRGGVSLTDGVGSSGDIYEQHADDVAELVVKGQSAEALLDRLASRGSAGGRAVQRGGDELVQYHPPTFADMFNHEFAAQLHAFATGDGPATHDAHAASGDGLTEERLEQLFTPHQRELLVGFFRDHMIPDRLFDGDEVGTATAQQRIELAGHILAVGRIRSGSIMQGVHARMCGHWAELVIHYAGAGSATGQGIIDQFGFSGGLDMSVTDGAGEHHASTDARTRTQASPDEATRFAQSGIAREVYDTIVTGDWLYLYNSNGVAGGNHSVIFSRWAGAWSTYHSPHGDVEYRRAVTMSQIGPSVGGREEIRTLGMHMVRMTEGDDANHDILPVTRVIHVSESSRPMQTAAELETILGHGDTAERNHAYVLRQAHGDINWQSLIDFIVARNAALIEQLNSYAGTMTPHQLEAFTGVNHGTGEDRLDTLVRLNERLALLVRNRGAIEEGSHGARETAMDTHHDELVESQRAERERLDAQLADAQTRMAEAQHRDEDVVPADRSAFDAAHAEVNRLRELQAQTPRGPERRRVHAELMQAIHAQHTASVALNHARREVDREHRHIQRDVNQAQLVIDRVMHRVNQLDGIAGYHTAAGGVGRTTFQGTRSEVTTGLVQHLDHAPDWTSLRR